LGVLTDYFVARDDQDAARAHAAIAGPKKLGFKTAEWKSIDPAVNLAVLEEIVNGTNMLEWIKAHPDEPVRVAGSDEEDHWVFRVTAQHAETLANLPDDVRSIAERWAKSEELDGSDPSDLADVLVSLRGLAREARDTRQGLYCWVSL
jgi:hypothetical protein